MWTLHLVWCKKSTISWYLLYQDCIRPLDCYCHNGQYVLFQLQLLLWYIIICYKCCIFQKEGEKGGLINKSHSPNQGKVRMQDTGKNGPQFQCLWCDSLHKCLKGTIWKGIKCWICTHICIIDSYQNKSY